MKTDSKSGVASCASGMRTGLSESRAVMTRLITELSQHEIDFLMMSEVFSPRVPLQSEIDGQPTSNCRDNYAARFEASLIDFGVSNSWSRVYRARGN